MGVLNAFGVAVLSSVLTASSAQTPSPTWPTAFKISFNESTSTRGTLDNNATVGGAGRAANVVATEARQRGGVLPPRCATRPPQWYYDFANGRARMDRVNGSKDRFCTGANKSPTMCQHLNPGKGAGRYLVWPAISSCCFCCTDDFGCGVLEVRPAAARGAPPLARGGVHTATATAPPPCTRSRTGYPT